MRQSPGAAVVTGGTGGIGAATCRLLAGLGVDVAFTYRSRHDVAEQLVAELTATGGAKARADAVDLTDAEATARYIDQVTEAFGGIHTVVHAAGPHIPMVHLSKVPPAQFRTALDGEAAAFFNLVSAAL